MKEPMKRPHGYQPKTLPTHQNSASYSTSSTPINQVPRTVKKSPSKLFSFSFYFIYHLNNFPPSLSFLSLTLTMFFSFTFSLTYHFFGQFFLLLFLLIPHFNNVFLLLFLTSHSNIFLGFLSAKNCLSPLFFQLLLKKSPTILQEPPPNFPLLSFIGVLPFTILFITLLPPATPINSLPLPFLCGPAPTCPPPHRPTNQTRTHPAITHRLHHPSPAPSP